MPTKTKAKPKVKPRSHEQAAALHARGPVSTNDAAEPVDVVLVLDRSGSMSSIKASAIESFNAFLHDQKQVPGAAVFTLVQFDDQYEVHQHTVPLGAALFLNDQTYQPRGGTALNDAIGRTLTAMAARSPARAVLAVLTDGQENASREYTRAQIRTMIEHAQARGWQVLYLSSDINAFADAKNYGVTASNVAYYQHSPIGLRAANFAMSASTTAYRTNTADTGIDLNALTSGLTSLGNADALVRPDALVGVKLPLRKVKGGT